MRRGREHQRAGHAEMREEQLPEIGVDPLSVLVDRQPHVPQAQALQLRAAVRAQRHERARERRDRVTEHRRHAMPLAGRAGTPIAHAAGRQHDRLRGICTLLALDAAHRAGLVRQHAHRSVAHKRDAQPSELPLQRGGHVERAVRHREHAPPALDLERHAELLKERHRTAPVEAGERGIQKPPVLRHVCQQLLTARVVRHIAPALAGDVELLAQPLVRLEQRDGCSSARRADRRHHSGGSAADHRELLIHPRPSRKCRSDPRRAPAR